jgi:hypothetical protein
MVVRKATYLASLQTVAVYASVPLGRVSFVSLEPSVVAVGGVLFRCPCSIEGALGCMTEGG